MSVNQDEYDEMQAELYALQDKFEKLKRSHRKLQEMLADELVKSAALSWRLGSFMKERYEEDVE